MEHVEHGMPNLNRGFAKVEPPRGGGRGGSKRVSGRVERRVVDEKGEANKGKASKKTRGQR